MTIAVRPARFTDLRALVELSGLVQELHVANLPADFRPPREREVARWFNDMLQDEETWVWIAEHERYPVGFAVAFINERPDHPYCCPSRSLEIDQIGVRAEWQRRGIGRALVGKALEVARERGLDRVELGSWSFNRDAHEAFQHLGFAPLSTRYRRDVIAGDA